MTPGSQFGQFRIIRLLGRGGMGEVFEVEHRVLGRRYALKLLPADFGSRPDAIHRFEREARVMAILEDPNIVRVDDFGETDGRCWIRMELVQGLEPGVVTLADHAERCGGRIPPEEFASIMIQILDGLRRAHEKGIVHRDLKPGNILLEKRPDGGIAVKIADFGLAKVLGEEFVRGKAQASVSSSLGSAPTLRGDMSVGDMPTTDGAGTSTRALLGTWEYMSPEQRRGEEADKRSDVYAAGLIAYRLLTGQPLGLKSASRLVQGLDPAWDDVIGKALENDPKDRWADGEEMFEQVLVIRHPPRAVPAPGPQPSPKSAADPKPAPAPEAAPAKPAPPVLPTPKSAPLPQKPAEPEGSSQVDEPVGGGRKNTILLAVVVVLLVVGLFVRIFYKGGWDFGWKTTTSNQSTNPPAGGSGGAAKDGSDASIVKLVVPSQVTQGESFEIKVFVHTPSKTGAGLRFRRNNQDLGEQYVQLDPGTNQFSFPQTLTETGIYSYEVSLIVSADTNTWNNRSGVTVTVLAKSSTSSLPPATKENPFVNTLGMKFVPVPGTEVLFSIWETRVKDYAAYAAENTGIDGSWKDPMYEGVPVTPGPEHPVVNVSWNDAVAFGEWLTKKELAAGKFNSNQSYRLPTDHEWSLAVGLGNEGNGSPKEKSEKVPGVYPWGAQWPPPAGAGNFADESTRLPFPALFMIDGYRDGFPTTAPVGSFSSNRHGLHDLAGNVWEWCEDYYEPGNNDRVLRGGSWDFVVRPYLLSSFRLNVDHSSRRNDCGFRLVLSNRNTDGYFTFRSQPPSFPPPRTMKETYQQAAAHFLWAAKEYRAQGDLQKAVEAERQAAANEAEASKL